MRVRCYLLSGGLSPGPALLSGFDRLSAPDRRSPTSCFSASDRVSVLDRRSFEVRLSSPDRFSSLPSWSPWGCRESCWIAQDYRTQKPPVRAWRSSLRAGSIWLALSVVALQSRIDSLGRPLQLTSDFLACHSGSQHFLELDFLQCCPAPSSGSRSGHFPFAYRANICTRNLPISRRMLLRSGPAGSF